MDEHDAEERRKQLAQSYRNSGEILVKKTRPGLLALARRRGLDAAAARDVVQQAFHALFEKRPRLANVEGWLVRVVLRRTADWFRREKARDACHGAIVPEEPVDQLTHEQRLLVRMVVEKLPERQRLLIQARYFEGHSEAEAAALAGYAPGSYKQTMTRALGAIRRELERGCREAAGRSPRSRRSTS